MLSQSLCFQPVTQHDVVQTPQHDVVQLPIGINGGRRKHGDSDATYRIQNLNQLDAWMRLGRSGIDGHKDLCGHGGMEVNGEWMSPLLIRNKPVSTLLTCSQHPADLQPQPLDDSKLQKMLSNCSTYVLSHTVPSDVSVPRRRLALAMQ